MEKSILKVSLLVGLSTLFTACSGSNGSESPSSKTPSTQSIPQNSQQPENGKKQTHSNNSDTNKEQITPPQSNNNDKNATNDLSNNQENPEQSPHAKKESSNQNNSNGVEKTPQNNLTEKQNSEKTNINSNKQHDLIHNNQIEKELSSKPNEPINRKNNETQPQHMQWNGQCLSATFCTYINEPSDAITVYDLNLKENATPQNTTIDKLEKQEKKITLKLGSGNKNNEYEFTLLGEQNNQVGYYGYRNTVSNKPDSRQVEVLYAINNKFKSQDQKPKFTANYKKSKGFIYTSITENSNIKNYGDVDLAYNNGKLSGSIYHLNSKEKIFSITTNNQNTTIITPVNDLQVTIKKDDKAELTYVFVDSGKNKGEHKYLLGAAKGETWTGVLAAEKQNNTH
ncbi:hypothetical protein ACFSAV_06000 [Pasteurella oralis]|uniref:Uncharacterized protein n=1 Tax=Pasteurella oralis TaxID=1071947 RepID=A0ABW4NTG2_9PAST